MDLQFNDFSTCTYSSINTNTIWHDAFKKFNLYIKSESVSYLGPSDRRRVCKE